jgi:PilZ domain
MKNEDSGVKKEEWIVMEERRKAERLEEENEVSINISSEETLIPVEEWSKLPEPNKKDENSSKEKIPYNRSKNISMSGANIQGNILLPVDTIIKIDITLSNLQQKITTIGKVKWNKVIIENESFEAGVEFVKTPDEAIQKLYERMQKDNAFIPVGDDMKICRYCSKEIKSDAVKCEYCGRILTERTAKRIFI